MEINELRIAVMLAGFLLFLALMVHTYSRKRSAEHEAAANLPFLDEQASNNDPSSKPQGGAL